MNKPYFFLSVLIVMTLACGLPIAAATPTEGSAPATSVPATEAPNEPPTALPPSFERAAVSYGSLSLVLPMGVASGFSGSQFPRAEGDNVAPWEVTPGHTQITLEGYLLQGKFHQPQIFVYPATEYAVMVPAAFESMHRLRNVMYDPSSSTSVDQLPGVPFFNAGPVFASNLQPIAFQNGDGMRFLTEYAQYAAPVNNHELIYQYQGFTDDGEYYLLAIFPITVPVLAENSEPGAALPPGGVTYPDISDPNADITGYYTAVTDLLNAASPETFAPTISQLDTLIGSLQVTP